MARQCFVWAGLVAGWLASAGAGQASTQIMPVYPDITGPELQELLQDWGYRAALSTDGVGDPKIETSTQGLRFTIYFYGCDQAAVRTCRSLTFRAGFDLEDGFGLASINDWNRGSRAGMAYLDEEDDPILEMHVNLDGGASADLLKDWMFWWDKALGEFVEVIGWR